MDLVICKMSSPAMLCKNNESGMRECDKFWKAKSEIKVLGIKNIF